jgi:hypothetical protein
MMIISEVDKDIWVVVVRGRERIMLELGRDDADGDR